MNFLFLDLVSTLAYRAGNRDGNGIRVRNGFLTADEPFLKHLIYSLIEANLYF